MSWQTKNLGLFTYYVSEKELSSQFNQDNAVKGDVGHFIDKHIYGQVLM